MQVPEVRYYLKNPKGIDSTLICMQVKYCGERVFISTGEKASPKEWDFNRQRVIVSRKNLSASTTNNFLDKIATTFKNVFRDLLIQYDLPKASLVTEKLLLIIDADFKPKTEKIFKKMTFFQFIENFIQESNALKSRGTVQTYISTFNHLKQHGILKNKEFDFEDITIEWRSFFIKYLQDLGCARNTEGKHIKNIKVFLNEATERKINLNLEFRSRSFSKPAEDVEKVFLTKPEIQQIIDLDLSRDTSKDIVRDYYIISCYTSLRYSDFTNIQPENIKENTLELITSKTNEGVIIPIAPTVRAIFKKYNNNLPKAPCNQVFNLLLKDVCRLAGLTERVTITKTIAGKKQSKTYEKYQLISCHTGRRTMISNCILEGISTSSIMLMSAHKSLKVFQKYVRITKQQNADALKEHSYFN